MITANSTDSARNANAFASTFLFFAAHKATLKNKKELASQRTWTLQTCTDTAMNVNRFGQSVCGLETVVLRGKSRAAHNRKINANFLFGGFIASYESLCVNEQLCFVSTVVRKLPQIKNFVYPLCVAFDWFSSLTIKMR